MNNLGRKWLVVFLTGWAWSSIVLGQQSGSGSSGGSTGSSSSTGSGSTSGSTGSGSAVGTGSGSSSSFSTSSGAPAPAPADTGSTDGPAPTANGAAVPAGGTSRPSTEAPPSFSVPGFYGQGSTNFTAGTGRLAKPKFETNVTFGFGYDDNLNQAPRSTPGIGPAQFVESGTETYIEATPGTRAYVAGGLLGTTPTVTYTTKTRPVYLELPQSIPTERESSLFSRVGLALQMQTYTRRSLFVANANLSESYYFDRSKDKSEFSGSLNLTYLYKFTPRLQVTAQVNSAYISQPDLSRPNTPERQTQGDVINSLARLDIAYRATPRLTLSLTGNYSGNRYTEKTEQTGDFDEFTTGLEARYLWSPRWTLLAEYRHSATTYLNRNDLDSTTEYLLLGSEFIINPRLSGTLRFGGALKSFDVGNSQTAPYVESSVMYRSTARSSVSWTNRFGFEEPGSPNEERLVYRSTVSFNYMFTPKLRGSIGANLVHELTTNSETNVDVAQDTGEATLALEYQWTRRFSLNGSYTFTLVNTNTGLIDYYRNRVFIGGQYTF